MRKLSYYIALAILFIAIWFILAFVLMSIGVIGVDYGGFGYRLGTAVGTPSLLVISLGITLLMRKVVYGKILGQIKDFSKGFAVFCVVFGSLWLAINIGGRMMSDYAKGKMMEQYQQSE